ncbi:MAG: hypothetical protein FJX72_20620 [Armatimonadetes bacterium]|nr:hypothetical protein [Armatimonadota bacterium]
MRRPDWPPACPFRRMLRRNCPNVASARQAGASRSSASASALSPQPSAARFVREAFERGVNYYDVAPSYANGEAEEKVGKALSPQPSALSRPRVQDSQARP